MAVLAVLLFSGTAGTTAAHADPDTHEFSLWDDLTTDQQHGLVDMVEEYNGTYGGDDLSYNGEYAEDFAQQEITALNNAAETTADPQTMAEDQLQMFDDTGILDLPSGALSGDLTDFAAPELLLDPEVAAGTAVISLIAGSLGAIEAEVQGPPTLPHPGTEDDSEACLGHTNPGEQPPPEVNGWHCGIADVEFPGNGTAADYGCIAIDGEESAGGSNGFGDILSSGFAATATGDCSDVHDFNGPVGAVAIPVGAYVAFQHYSDSGPFYWGAFATGDNCPGGPGWSFDEANYFDGVAEDEPGAQGAPSGWDEATGNYADMVDTNTPGWPWSPNAPRCNDSDYAVIYKPPAKTKFKTGFVTQRDLTQDESTTTQGAEDLGLNDPTANTEPNPTTIANGLKMCMSDPGCMGDGSNLGTITQPIINSDPPPPQVEIPAPLPNEVFTDYATTLNNLGLYDLWDNTLSAEDEDPFAKPNTIVSVEPAPGTKVTPEDDPEVEVDSNPAQDPNGQSDVNPIYGNGGPPDPFTGPVIDPNGIDFPNVPTPCNVFPFGVPCWLVSQMGQLTAAPVAPHFDFSTPFGQTIDINFGDVFGFDMGELMNYARPILLFLSFAGFLLWLARRSPGGGGGEGLGGGEDTV